MAGLIHSSFAVLQNWISDGKAQQESRLQQRYEARFRGKGKQQETLEEAPEPRKVGEGGGC